MGRYMTELGMTPAPASRVRRRTRACSCPAIEFRTIYEAKRPGGRSREAGARLGSRSPGGRWAIESDRDGCLAARRT